MPKLTTQQLEQFQQRLQARKRELMGELDDAQAEVLTGTDTVGREVIDQKDLADRAEEANLHEAEAERDHRELLVVQAALNRIEAGTYGVCIDCEEPIALARLEAWPAAARCLPCQEAHEQQP